MENPKFLVAAGANFVVQQNGELDSHLEKVALVLGEKVDFVDHDETVVFLGPVVTPEAPSETVFMDFPVEKNPEFSQILAGTTAESSLDLTDNFHVDGGFIEQNTHPFSIAGRPNLDLAPLELTPVTVFGEFLPPKNPQPVSNASLTPETGPEIFPAQSEPSLPVLDPKDPKSNPILHEIAAAADPAPPSATMAFDDFPPNKNPFSQFGEFA